MLYQQGPGIAVAVAQVTAAYKRRSIHVNLYQRFTLKKNLSSAPSCRPDAYDCYLNVTEFLCEFRCASLRAHGCDLSPVNPPSSASRHEAHTLSQDRTTPDQSFCVRWLLSPAVAIDP